MQNTEASLCCPQFCPSSDILYEQSQTSVSLPEQVSSNKPIGHSLFRNKLVVAIAPKRDKYYKEECGKSFIPYGEYPSWEQTTLASCCVQWWSQIVFQDPTLDSDSDPDPMRWLLMQTSTLPLNTAPSPSLMSPSVQGAICQLEW